MQLTVSNLDFAYPEKASPILHNFQLEAKRGDFITLKGASGSGKSTFFRLLLGFEKPSHGTLIYKGKPLLGEVLQDFRRSVAWLPQDLDLGEGTLEEVFYFPFTFKNNKSKKPSKKETEKIFNFLGLNELPWHTDFKKLSTGQRQRIGVAICHFLNKEILLLDEPTSALDDTSKEKVKRLLVQKDKIILSASHDPWWIQHSTKIIEINPV